MNNYYTYAYLREDGTPYYIGKGKGSRINSPNRRLKLPPKERRLFLKQNLTEGEAFKHEIYMIFMFGRKDLGTGILLNMSNGGEGNSGHIATEETRNKMRVSHKGKVFSYNHRKKIGEANKRRTLSQETKNKISKSNKGKKLSEENKRKLCEANIGNQYSKGKITSNSTKLKLRQALIGSWKITFDDGRIILDKFSIREFCKEYEYDRKSIYNVMIGKSKKHKDIVAVEKLDTTP